MRGRRKQLSESEWIDKYPVDYQKICGDLIITELEYSGIICSLRENNLQNLVDKLHQRKGTIYKNYDVYYQEQEVLKGHPIKH